MTTLTELRKRKKEWLLETLSKSDLRVKLKLQQKDIELIEPETKYGMTRYPRARVSWFLKLKGKHLV